MNIHNKKITSFAMITAIASGLILSGCERNISSNVYSAASVGEASFSYQGVIVSARQVMVKESEYLAGNKQGIAIGGITGAVAGSAIGGGSGNAAATILGGVAGATAGAFVQDKLTQQNAFEYVVKLTNGQIMTVVQGLDSVMAVGQRVMVLVSHDGRSRVIPDNTGIVDVQDKIPAPQVRVNKSR
jgi:outer membrane lipoprotein SlyB